MEQQADADWITALEALELAEAHVGAAGNAAAKIANLLFQGRLDARAAQRWVSIGRRSFKECPAGVVAKPGGIITRAMWRASKQWGKDQTRWLWLDGDFCIKLGSAPNKYGIFKGVQFSRTSLLKHFQPAVATAKNNGGRPSKPAAWAACALETIRLFEAGQLTLSQFPKVKSLSIHLEQAQSGLVKPLSIESINPYASEIYNEILKSQKNKN